MRKLNKTDIKICIFIKNYIQENGFPPSYREIGESVKLKSLASVNYSVNKLQEFGLIKLIRNENDILYARGIKIINQKLIKQLEEQIDE